ncbi:MAG: RdgB/HAM1 family non-canonical purine NTP pyrophosphatase [Christensenellaceae bacterium]
MKIVAASGNLNKLREFREILKGFEIVTQKDAGFEGEVEETGTTFLENALLKARAVAKALSVPALADDSGICCPALNGEPGIYSARYSGGHGDDEENNALLLKNLQGKDRSAYYFCAVVLAYPDGTYVYGEGRTDGFVTETPQGNNGFGYDPYFYSTELGKPFGIATPEEKNSVSHRARALKALYAKIGETI